VQTKQEQQERKQAATQNKAAASKAEASKAAAVGAKSKDDAKAKDGSSSSSDSRAFNTALVSAKPWVLAAATVLPCLHGPVWPTVIAILPAHVP
jgi:type IV secretory pathway VirB10-like protein